MTYCILAAGRGSRLQEITKIHKALAPIGQKAVISHIIDKAPLNSEIVIAVGHQANLIKEYCLAAHPEKKFIFVEVDNYDGPGSGPGYSLFCCKKHLQRPFYLVCSDCMVPEPLPNLHRNWIGVSPVDDPENWSTANVEYSHVNAFKNKSKDGYQHAFIGLAGIKDYEVFWKQLRQSGEKEFEMVSAFYDPTVYGGLFAYDFIWHDTGTPYNYRKSSVGHKTLGLNKEINEHTYKVGNRCIKLFLEPEIAQRRIARAKILEGLIPNIVYSGNNVYAYQWVEGKTMYECDLPTFKRFLDWCQNELWQDVGPGPLDCMQFYKQKTQDRFNQYLRKKQIFDCACNINGINCLPMQDYLDQIDWEVLSSGVPVLFHGDLQFENIIFSDTGFKLIDWRDCFGESKTRGDLYYEFAKLYGGLCMSYHEIKHNGFSIKKSESIELWFNVPENLQTMRYYFENWLLKNGYNLRKVRILTALIYLNMSPLHTSPFDEMLFNQSKYLLSLNL